MQCHENTLHEGFILSWGLGKKLSLRNNDDTGDGNNIIYLVHMSYS